MVNISDLFYLCSLIEVIGRKQKLARKDVVNALGLENVDRIYRQAEILHCEPIEKIADEYIDYVNIPKGDFDNVADCRYTVPDHWTKRKQINSVIHRVTVQKAAALFSSVRSR